MRPISRLSPLRSFQEPSACPSGPSHKCGAGCQSRTHRSKHHQITSHDPSLLDHLVQRQRKRGTGGVSVACEDRGHTLVRHSQPFSGSIENPLVRLVRNDHRDVRWCEAIPLEDGLNALDHRRDRKLEHRSSILLQEVLAGRHRGHTRRQEAPSGRHQEVVTAAAVNPVVEIENSVSRLCPFEEGRACAIAEEHGSGPVEWIDDRAHEIGADDDNPFVNATRHQLSAGRKPVEKSRASRGQIEAPRPAQTQSILDEAGGRRKEHVGCDRRHDDGIDLIMRKTPLRQQTSHRLSTHHRSSLAWGTDSTLADTGPGDDPVIGGVQALGQLGVGENPIRNVRGNRGDRGAQRCGPELIWHARISWVAGITRKPTVEWACGVGSPYISPMPLLSRRPTVTTIIGGVPVGSDHPVVVQSMTNTDTADVASTVRQVAELAQAGSELVRVTVNNEPSAAAVPAIVEELDRLSVVVPIIGDFHYNGHLLLAKYPDCAQALSKYRINPGNVGGKRHDENFRAIIEVALAYSKPVRIGVNWGSLDQSLLTRLMDANAGRAAPRPARDVVMEAMVESALQSAALAEATGLGHDRIVLSAKVSGVQDLVDVYRLLAARCDYPLHLGLTEAGLGSKGIIASTAGLSILLQEGIGDTIRVSLTPAPGGDRTEEVRVAQQVLQSLGLRSFSPQVTSCPGCGRTTSTFFQQMAQEIQDYLQDKMPVWRSERPGVQEMKVAVMGCVVNGPGESKHADIGISLPGTAEEPKAPVYVDGRLLVTLRGNEIVSEFLEILEDYVASRYGAAEPAERR